MTRVSNAVMTRECHADVVRMLRECCANPAHMSHVCCTDEVRASYARHSSSKCNVKRAGYAHTRVVPDVRSALHTCSMGTFGQYCALHIGFTNFMRRRGKGRYF
jgi:hypothetical protein